MRDTMNLDEIFATLEQLSTNFDKNSKEYFSVRNAAWGLHYLKRLGLEEKFLDYLKDINEAFSGEIVHRQYLRWDSDT